MKRKIRVVIADDHDIYLEGLESRLNSSEDIEVVGAALNGELLVHLVRQHQPDVVITDIRMPVMDGIEAIKRIRKIDDQIQILVLSTFDSTSFVIDAMEEGAIGYILKDTSKEDVIEAVKLAYQQTAYCSPQINLNLSKFLKASRRNSRYASDDNRFSLFEKKIIHHICEERTSEEIAGLLYIGKRSIENYRSKILVKMKVKTSIGIAVYAYKNRLYPLPDELLNDR